MELIAKERDRLLQRSARLLGLAGVAISLLSLSLPGVVPLDVYLWSLPFFAILVGSLVLIGRAFSISLALAGITSGLAVLLVLLLGVESPGPGLSAAAAPLASAGLGGFALVLTSSIRRLAILLLGLIGSTTLVWTLEANPRGMPPVTLSVLVGWVLAAFLSYWLTASVPRATRRIFAIGRAHRAERQASETEAQRRQSARLLHDTVLATLTLLAHSGIGVAPEALRQQAADDARLLRQLRLGATPTPQSSGSYNLEPVEETVLGTTLESVKQRFGRMGLEVSWHGTGQVLLPSDVLDAFLLSLAECLENVRRHAGVTQAHVTITDDTSTVRAMVTDSGIGFDFEGIDEDKLGFRESVLGRLREVGGNARLFSSPGAGTTVVLEVPK